MLLVGWDPAPHSQGPGLRPHSTPGNSRCHHGHYRIKSLALSEPMALSAFRWRAHGPRLAGTRTPKCPHEGLEKPAWREGEQLEESPLF